ncbi:MAG: hypothetical protein QXT45_00900 [Candidatus Bilamarchaeaceae archaeon]
MFQGSDLKLGLVVFIAIILVGIFFIKIEPPSAGGNIVYLEDRLEKNRNISFNDGDVFYYVFNSSNFSTDFEFVVDTRQDCTNLYAKDSSGFSCVKEDGTDLSGSNLTLADRNIFFFRPWMLALNDNWKWAARGCFEINKNLSCDIVVSFKVIRTEFENGKKQYVVRAVYGSTEVYYWVEDERRILSKEIGPGYTITIRQ